jgi:membrane associated rhomboid family serine protease
MFFLLPVQVKEPDGGQRVPFANALLIAINVLVFFLNGYLGWPLAVGKGASLPTIITYGFAHADAWHLITNMWFLWLFGNPVNRRLGDGYYLLCYLGTIVALGIVAWLFAGGGLLGSSGAIFAVMLLFMMLMPRAVVRIGYVALFPFTLLVGLFSRPKHWVFWFLRWDAFEVRALIGLVLIPLLEVWSLWSWGWNWTNLGHLFGLLCGVATVLLLPTEITMNRRAAAGSVS